MRTFLRLLLYIPLAVLTLVYLKYSISGLLLEKECYGIVSALGFNPTVTAFLVRLVFPLDGTVALLFMFGARIRRFPWHLLFLWAGVWPWVPRVLQWYGGLGVEYGEAAAVSVLAVLAFYLHHSHGITFFKRKKK